MTHGTPAWGAIGAESAHLVRAARGSVRREGGGTVHPNPGGGCAVASVAPMAAGEGVAP
jgi:hypothetical protein